MLTGYIVIGILLFIVANYCIWLNRNIDGGDLMISAIVFGVIWPVGLIFVFFNVLIAYVNHLRKP